MSRSSKAGHVGFQPMYRGSNPRRDTRCVEDRTMILHCAVPQWLVVKHWEGEGQPIFGKEFEYVLFSQYWCGCEV